MLRALGIPFTIVASVGTVWASDKPVYAPAPAWVNAAPAPDMAGLPADKPHFLIFDQQQRIEEGTVWRYQDTARAIHSAEMLQQAGTIALAWAPDHGDLIVHRAEILRGGETIDLLKDGRRFEVLQREEGLEKRTMDGELTATMAVEGLRIGDVLRLAYSTSARDPALGGHVQTFVPLLTAPTRAAFGRTRLQWPEKLDLKLRTHLEGVALEPKLAGGFREVELRMPLAKLPDMPDDAPARFHPMPVIEATSFADWQAVSRTMAAHYQTQGTIAAGSPIAGEVARIAKASTDPKKRAGLALQTVQGEIRYLYQGMNGGNYVPQSPERTWAARYGDCKAKTLLLLAMLRELGIEAEPVLVNSTIGDVLPDRLPSAGMFDHVIVRAVIDGEEYWLDGTRGGAMPEDIGDTLPFRHALPLRSQGAGLIPVPLRPSERPEVMLAITYDQRAGIDFPAPFVVEMTFRGEMGMNLQEVGQQASQEQLAEAIGKGMASFVDSGTLYAEAIAFDPATGYATMRAKGIAYPDWAKQGSARRFAIQNSIGGMEFKPDRSRAAWKAIPVARGAAGHVTMTTRILLPDSGKGFAFEGAMPLETRLAGIAITREGAIDDGVARIFERERMSGDEIAAAEIAATRDAVARAKARPLMLTRTDGAPRHAQIAAARKAKAFDAILAAYDADIAQSPDEALLYYNRAWFKGSIYDRAGAIEDLGRAIAIDQDVDYYVARAQHHVALDQEDAAIADLEAAMAIEPGSYPVLSSLAVLRADRGDGDAAIELIADRASTEGDEGRSFLALKADVLGRTGAADEAIAAIDEAVASRPRDAALLNQRCWLRGTLNVGLDEALKDCTRSIELGESPAGALDSRAMVYFRMQRFDEALADLDAALDIAPDMAASLYLRGIVAKARGDAEAGEADLAAARTMAPRIDEDYRRWGVVP